MKKIYAFITLLAVLTFAACSEEDFTSPTESGLPSVSDYADDFSITVNQETNYVTFEFTGSGVYPVWIVNGSSYSTDFSFTSYYRKAGEYEVEAKVGNANGLSDGSLTLSFEVENTIMNGFSGFVYDSEYNLWLTATKSTPSFWYAPGWSQIDDPTYTVDSDYTYTVSLPEATTDQWQAQMFINTDISTASTSNYDFSIILTSTTDHTAGVTVKLTDPNDDTNYYFAKRVTLEANEPTCYYQSDMPGLDINNLQLVLDFGGNEANTVMTIESIVIKDHANDDGTEVPEEEEVDWVSATSEDNLWYGVTYTNWFYYAPGWSQISDPTLTVVDDTTYTLSLPTATDSQWQCQVFFITDDLSLASDQTYDFKVTLSATNDISAVTVKLCENDDDDSYLFTDNVNVTADTETTFKATSLAGIDIAQVKLVFDFGGNPANTTVTISDIVLQIHTDE